MTRGAIDDQAAAWVARMDRGDWTDASEQELRAWLEHDPRRAGALLQAQAAWTSTDPALCLARPPVATAHLPAEPPGHPAVSATAWSRMISRRRAVGYGGGVIAAVLAGGLVWSTRPKRYVTTVGEIRWVPLPDGSAATINTQSDVAIAFEKEMRRVSLKSGQAWFQVAKDAERPFVVEAGRIRVRALGTAFSVQRHDTGAEVLVTEGVVDAWADGAEGNSIRLAAGSAAYVADNAAIRPAAASPSSIERALAWRSGQIDLVGSRLDGAVAEFNRYNKRQLIVADPRLAAEQLDGNFRVDDPEGFAKIVGDTFEARIDLSDPDTILIGAGT
jgi:transmembrane sensor